METNATNSPVSPLTVTQDQEGTVSSLVYANQGQGGDVVATASSVANNNNVYADSYGDSVTSTQANNAAVNANSSATVGTWTGSAVSTAYGVGNSTVISNAGSYTGLESTQNNSGAITVNASLYNGSSGGRRRRRLRQCRRRRQRGQRLRLRLVQRYDLGQEQADQLRRRARRRHDHRGPRSIPPPGGDQCGRQHRQLRRRLFRQRLSWRIGRIRRPGPPWVNGHASSNAAAT